MLSVIRTSAAIAIVALAALARPARAQLGEVDVQRGPTAELYVRKRPPTPAAPVLSPELQRLLNAAKTKRDAKREQAIGLLREFLASKPLGESKADGMFKLGELLWEEARRQFLVDMDTYDRRLEACRTAKACKQPTEPRIQLREAETLYKQILVEFPGFRRADLILYLVGFAAKEDNREDQALASFQRVIKEHPQSPLYGDAWMQVGEHYFGQQQWADARGAYENVLSNPNAPTYDLAMFKSAWCDWKLGQPEVAAKKFKIVLDLAIEAERAGNPELARRRANLRDEALEYLVVVFTEDRAISAKEVFDFLASIGGERYSRDILIKVADSYASQGEYERAADTYRFLVAMDPDALGAAAWQRQIVDTWVSAGDYASAQRELAGLVEGYGPTSAWAKKQRNREALARSLEATEALARQTAINLHAEAQTKEKRDKRPDRAAYDEAAGAYGIYLGAFGDPRTGAKGAAELRFYRAQILFFKLGKLEEAGDEFLLVGRSTPVGKFHKDALLAAMDAFEKARPKDTAGKRQLLPVDTKFAEAVDLYATLFPADPKLVEVIFKNGQLFYDYGNFDEAIKRFGLIVTKYPDDPNAGPAGDRILKGLAQAQDYENIEDWARRLKKAKAFAAPDQQARLDRLIVDSIGKSGDKYADAGKYEQAAQFYLRIPKEFPKDKAAPQKMMNAGVMYEKAKLPERAADVYLEIADQYGEKNPDLAEKAAFTAGQVYENVTSTIARPRPTSWSPTSSARRARARRRSPTRSTTPACCARRSARTTRPSRTTSSTPRSTGSAKTPTTCSSASPRSTRPPATTATPIRRTARTCASYRDRRARGRGLTSGPAAPRSSRASSKPRREVDGRPRSAAGRRCQRRGEGPQPRLGRRGALLRGRADVPRVREGHARREAEGPQQDAQEEGGDAREGPERLPRRRQLRGSQVGDRGALSGRAGLRRVRRGARHGRQQAAGEPVRGRSGASLPATAVNAYVVDIQDKAVQLFSTGYQKAIQMQVYDQYTAKIREALGRLAADKYPPEREARGKVRTGDRPLTLELVEEVAR